MKEELAMGKTVIMGPQWEAKDICSVAGRETDRIGSLHGLKYLRPKPVTPNSAPSCLLEMD